MLAIKSRILRIWDSASTGVRICCIKFAQRVVLVQTAGPDADPKVRNFSALTMTRWLTCALQRGNLVEVSLTMVPQNHALLAPRNLEAEASGLLDRMLGVFQENLRYPSLSLLLTAIC